MKRRNFINTVVTGATGISLGASVMTTESCSKGANDKIVIALIGSGSRGTETIISTCKLDSNVEIKTVCSGI